MTTELPTAARDSLLTGNPTEDAVHRLMSAERVRRSTVALKHVRRKLSGLDLSPLPAAEDAFRILEAAERADADAADEVVMYPHVGAWLVHLVKRLYEVERRDTPLWHDVGYLHLLAAAAAIRAGIDFTLSVPAPLVLQQEIRFTVL
ncbi:hypothetical protein [Catenuloplanes indicus]|uniref:HEXXH motif-containing protein n=1 Tax=Catenuloplanes indicus TaxID=137267 RepID=A0AAE3VVA9_9ACTN|nr:hypothetical protein [Catenuloplanes indicus]MDQ0364688.1 HEXXH motif-containing protein [Catenuloplanes indicus]